MNGIIDVCFKWVLFSLISINYSYLSNNMSRQYQGIFFSIFIISKHFYSKVFEDFDRKRL